MALAMSKGINCPEPGLEGHGWPRYSGPRFQLPPRVTKCLDKAQIASSCPSIHDHPAVSNPLKYWGAGQIALTILCFEEQF